MLRDFQKQVANSSMKILVIEDDPRISDVIEYALKGAGYETTTIRRGRDGIERVGESLPDLIVLDIGLPDIDGFEVCRAIRKHSDVPIIFLTSRSDEIDRIVGLEIGGDDYVVKPFSPREMVARVKAVLRRQQRSPVTATENRVQHGPIAIDLERFRVSCGKCEIALTAQEFKLVELFVRHPGRVFTRQQLLNRAWGDGGLVTDRTIDAHIKALRRKFGDVDFIETVRGIGYRARDL
jgi:two-component system, OmpR family, response regulator